jgi:hypothetical protein
MPGLVRGVARTAMVAGTATAVSNRVSRRQAGRWAEQEERAYAQQQHAQQRYVVPPQSNAAPPPGPSGMTDEAIARLRQLGELRDAGVLTEEEFQTQKARLLG